MRIYRYAAVDAKLPRWRKRCPTPHARLHEGNCISIGRSVLRVSLRPLVIAHRGACGYRPEHTRAAFQLAIDLGADAVEPDLVPTRDGVLVIRHENEISGTTDVASRPEFASLRTTKTIEGTEVTGWFTEDFTWAELETVRARERLPKTRPTNAKYDGQEGILRLVDLIGILGDAGRPMVMVAELKHAQYFESIGLPLDATFARDIAGWATPSNLIVESFEESVLAKVQDRSVPGRLVFLAEASGVPADQRAEFGAEARPFSDYLTDAGLAKLASEVDGISVDKSLLLAKDARGSVTGTTDLVARARDLGLETYAWTLRSENHFLEKPFRRGLRDREQGDWRGEFELIMKTGVDGVFADQPDLAIRARSGL
jgi:glycerophosphoryl diester phosphodiesterase